MITYNQEKYIRQALESVFAQQTDFEFEVVIGEDCSTDHTRSIIKEFEAKYPDKFFPVYHNENVGMMRNAFEFCYPKLRGKYIAFLEGDDYWTDMQKLQKQVDFLNANPEYSGVFSEAIIVNLKNNNVVNSNKVPGGINVIRYNDLIQRMMIHTVTMIFRNHIYLREMMTKIMEYPYGDLPLFLHVSLFGPIKYLNEPMAAYRQNIGVMSVWNKHEGFYKKLFIIDRFSHEFPISLQNRWASNISKSWIHLKLAKNLAMEGNAVAFKHYFLFLYNSLFKLVYKGKIIERVQLADYARPFKYFVYSRIMHVNSSNLH